MKIGAISSGLTTGIFDKVGASDASVFGRTVLKGRKSIIIDRISLFLSVNGVVTAVGRFGHLPLRLRMLSYFTSVNHFLHHLGGNTGLAASPASRRRPVPSLVDSSILLTEAVGEKLVLVGELLDELAKFHEALEAVSRHQLIGKSTEAGFGEKTVPARSSRR